MTDPLFRNIGADIEQTIASLDALHSVNRARRDLWLNQLRGIVAGLDAPGLPDEEPQPIERPVRDEPRRSRREREYEITDEDLPQRKTSRGGPFGPAVRAKLVREALRESDW